VPCRAVGENEVRTNTTADIRHACGGRLCASIQLDTQHLSPWNFDQIRGDAEAPVRELQDLRGGLMLYAYVGVDVPFENLEALCSALEETCQLPLPSGAME
jgi:hypothetical protein